MKIQLILLLLTVVLICQCKKKKGKTLTRFAAKTYHAQEGSDVSLFCVTKDSFEGFFKKSSNGSFQKYPSLKVDDGKDFFLVRKLLLRNVNTTDAGRYYCKSKNKTASTKLFVYPQFDSPEQPRFHSPVSTTYPSSGWASIFCKSSNRRDLTLYHVHNNGQAQRMTKRFLGSRRNYESRGELMLYSLRPWHYGYYLCKNGRNMTAVTRLDFSDSFKRYRIPPLKLGRTGKIDIGFDWKLDKVVGGGNFVRYSLDGKRVATRFGDFRATFNKRFKLTKKGVLIIKNVRKEDAGYYFVEHFKSSGNTSVFVTVTVKE